MTVLSAARLITLATLIAAPIALAGQAPPPAPDGRRGLAPPPPTNTELATILDAYALVEAQKALQLDDEQYGRFVSRLNRLQDTRRRNLQLRTRMVNELRKLSLDPATDEGIIRERLTALRAHDDQAATALRRDYDSLDEVLTPRQQVRFRVFENQLEARKLDLLMRARERARANRMREK
jgi:hypothetical protein